MKTFRRAVVWLLHIGSWVLALYLFATGNILGGIGAGATSFVLSWVYILLFVMFAPDFIKAAEEGREAARKEGYEAERRRLRSA
jgi:hypothetical protein